MDFQMQNKIRLYPRLLVSNYLGHSPDFGLATFVDAATISPQEQALYVRSGITTIEGYELKFSDEDAQKICSAYVGRLTHICAWRRGEGTWDAYTDLDPTLIVTAYEVREHRTEEPQPSIASLLVSLQQGVFGAQRDLIRLHLQKPEIVAEIDFKLTTDRLLSTWKDTGFGVGPAESVSSIYLLDSICRVVSKIMDDANG